MGESVCDGWDENAAGAKDLVGALIRQVGLEKGQIGKVDVKETFSLVEVAPQAAEQAVRRLTGVAIRAAGDGEAGSSGVTGRRFRWA